jgi:hypothetical protein
VVNVIVAILSTNHYCLRYERGMVHVVSDYIVYHYCLRFDIGVVHVVVAILSTITL